MSKKDRLLDLIGHFSNGNKSEFARMIGVSPQAINTWISRDTFDIETIYSKMRKHFSRMASHWQRPHAQV